MRATLKLVTIFPLMNKILLVNESNIEVSNDLPSNSRPAHYRCLIFPCLFLKVGQEKMAHGTDRGAANELSQRAKKWDGRNAYISHFIKLCRQTTVTLCDPPFNLHRIQSKSQQNRRSPLVHFINFFYSLEPFTAQYSKHHLTVAEFISAESSHSRLLSTLRWCLLG